MTDFRVSQLALYSPQTGVGPFTVSQFALYALTVEPAANVNISQMAIYSASIEYTLPTFYTGFRIPAKWGNPVYIERS